MKYKAKYTLQDFFMNKSLSGIFPQFTKSDLSNKLNQNEIVDKIAKFYSDSLGGKIDGRTITVDGTKSEILQRAEALKSVAERMFENATLVQANLKKNNKTKLYTSVQNIKQVRIMNDNQLLALLEEIMDNLSYNDSFEREGRDKTNSPFYQLRQLKWQSKVGYISK